MYKALGWKKRMSTSNLIQTRSHSELWQWYWDHHSLYLTTLLIFLLQKCSGQLDTGDKKGTGSKLIEQLKSFRPRKEFNTTHNQGRENKLKVGCHTYTIVFINWLEVCDKSTHFHHMSCTVSTHVCSYTFAFMCHDNSLSCDSLVVLNPLMTHAAVSTRFIVFAETSYDPGVQLKSVLHCEWGKLKDIPSSCSGHSLWSMFPIDYFQL